MIDELTKLDLNFTHCKISKEAEFYFPKNITDLTLKITSDKNLNKNRIDYILEKIKKLKNLKKIDLDFSHNALLHYERKDFKEYKFSDEIE